MGRIRKALVAGAALALSGCWLQPGFGPQRQNSNPFDHGLTTANVSRLQQLWSLPGATGSQPLATSTGLYTAFVDASSDQLTVRAVDRQSGRLSWQRHLPLPPRLHVSGILAAADDHVLVARLAPTGGFRFETLDPSTGAPTASFAEARLVDPDTVAISGNLIAYRAADVPGGGTSLVVRDRGGFEEMWTAPISAFSNGSGDPVLIHGRAVYLHDGAGPSGAPVVRAFALDGCGADTCTPTSTIEVPPPPPETGFASYEVELLAATDDGQLLLRRSWRDERDISFGTDLVALASDGGLDWFFPMIDLAGVAVAGDTVFAVGHDQVTPSGSGTLFARSGSSTWRADVPGLAGTPAAAGGLVYAEADVAGGTGVAVFDGGGCGAPSCAPVEMLDAGSGTGGLYGISITAGRVYVSKAGNPGGQLIAYAPTG